jgi:hypothetical protein
VNDVHDTDATEVGSLGEETARLLGALASWAKDQGADLGTGVGAMAGHTAGSWREVNDHIATGSEECTYCPICRTIHAVRGASPEVRAHLAVAAASLMQAAAGILATAVPDEERARSARGDGVEHIDLDDEPWTDDEADGDGHIDGEDES